MGDVQGSGWYKLHSFHFTIKLVRKIRVYGCAWSSWIHAVTLETIARAIISVSETVFFTGVDLLTLLSQRVSSSVPVAVLVSMDGVKVTSTDENVRYIVLHHVYIHQQSSSTRTL